MMRYSSVPHIIYQAQHHTLSQVRTLHTIPQHVGTGHRELHAMPVLSITHHDVPWAIARA
eukprot:560608-Rhodomonas_salina.11